MSTIAWIGAGATGARLARRPQGVTLVNAPVLDSLDRTTVICGDEVTEPKPAPEGLRLACRRLGVSPAATTYVGDAEVDLRCAASAGTAAVHARWDGSTTAVQDAPMVAHHPGDIVELLCCRVPADSRIGVPAE
ncbi:HAD family hydrolase [Micromonospora sp. NPDC047670]|uniref:HAD family hydrolase n=1 Tax=Micromonospora sp. NPDC047670 TaxID=3364252 RepID=UPI003717E7C0